MSDVNDLIVPPRWDGTNKNLQQIAVTGLSQRVALDPQLRRRCVRFKTTVGLSFYLRSDDSGTVDQTLTTTLPSTSETLGYPMAANTYEDFNLGGNDNYIVVQGTGAGVLTLLGSSPRPTAKEGA